VKVLNDLRPYADQILGPLSDAIYGRSPVLRKSFSHAIGHLAKLCTVDALSQLVVSLVTNFVDNTDTDMKMVSVITFLEMTRFSGENTSDFKDQFLPIAFMGSMASYTCANVCKDLWDENTASTKKNCRFTRMILTDVRQINPRYDADCLA
jgi:hypothetical protein